VRVRFRNRNANTHTQSKHTTHKSPYLSIRRVRAPAKGVRRNEKKIPVSSFSNTFSTRNFFKLPNSAGIGPEGRRMAHSQDTHSRHTTHPVSGYGTLNTSHRFRIRYIEHQSQERNHWEYTGESVAFQVKELQCLQLAEFNRDKTWGDRYKPRSERTRTPTQGEMWPNTEDTYSFFFALLLNTRQKVSAKGGSSTGKIVPGQGQLVDILQFAQLDRDGTWDTHSNRKAHSNCKSPP
jgi:hypothetical protein